MQFLGYVLLLLICSDGPAVAYQLARSRVQDVSKFNVRSLTMVSDQMGTSELDLSDKLVNKVLKSENMIETSEAILTDRSSTIPAVDSATVTDAVTSDKDDASVFAFGPIIALAMAPIAAFLVWRNLKNDDGAITTTATEVAVTREESIRIAKERAMEQKARRAAIIASAKADFEGRVEIAREKVAKENEEEAILKERVRLQEEQVAAIAREAKQKEEAEAARVAAVAVAKKQEEDARLAAVAKKEAEEKAAAVAAEAEAARVAAVAVAKKQEEDARLAAVAKKEAEVKAASEAAEALVVRLSAVAKSEREAAKLVAKEKLAVRMQLENEAAAKWDAEIVSAKLSDSSADSATGLPAPVSVKKMLMKKKKGALESVSDKSADAVALSLSGEGEGNAEGSASASTLMSSSTKKKSIAASVTSDTDMDIFDTIMGASLETEMAGKAQQVSVTSKSKGI